MTRDTNNDIIIIKNSDPKFFSGLNTVYSYYNSYTTCARAARKIIKILRADSALFVFYGKWRKRLEDIKIVILFDTGFDNIYKITDYIKRINPEIKIVFWYWNPVENNRTALADKNIDEIWSYNKFDADRYGFRYNPQFYHMTLIPDSVMPDADLVFLGKDKGRREILTGLKENAENLELKYNFTITEKNGVLEYEEYLRRVFKSKCIVDIVSNQECGLTLRPLEALFYKKKLVTNYEDIVNYDFYDKENVFLLGKDDINKLANFVDSPYKEIDEKIVDFYSYERWLKRIERGEDIKP